MRSIQALLLVLGAALVPLLARAQDFPAWVLNPPADGGLAAGDCVPASGSMGVDRQQATARARLALAQQIEVKIEAMDQTYESRVREGKLDKLSTSFVSSSKQTVNLTLQGARVVRTEAVRGRSGDLLCVMVALERQISDKMPGDIIRASGAKFDEDTEGMLVARFKQAAAARAPITPAKS